MKKKTKTITLEDAILKKDFRHNRTLFKHLTVYNLNEKPHWEDIDKDFLRNFKSFLHNKVSTNSVKTYCAYLRSILNDFSDYLEVSSKEYSKILNVKSVDCFNIYLNKEEIRKLIDYTPENEKEKIVRAQFVTSCLTGLRFSDVLKLDETNIVGDQIIYQAQKTKSIVYTPNCEQTTQYIRESLGIEYCMRTYNETIREICRKAGINDIIQVIHAGKKLTGEKYLFVSSHTGRRSFATGLYEDTKDLVLVCRHMGHSDPKQTLRYMCLGNNSTEALTYVKQLTKTA